MHVGGRVERRAESLDRRPHAGLVDLGRLDELRTISVSGASLEIGSMTSLTSLIRSSEVEVTRPILAEVAATVADVQVRNRGTLGGNICVNDPTNHFPPLLVALDASMTVAGVDGERVVPAEEFFVGVFETTVREGELLTKITVPAAGKGTGDGMSGVTLGAHGTYIANAAAGTVIFVRSSPSRTVVSNTPTKNSSAGTTRSPSTPATVIDASSATRSGGK